MRTILIRLSVIALFAVLTSGCEVQTLYEVQLSDLTVDQGSTIIQEDSFSLHLSSSNSMDEPGITLFAAVDDLEPTWDWEQFQGWPEEQQRSVFGAYYDRKHPSFDVAFQSACPLQVKRFDHRESAQEMAYGRWLHNVESGSDDFYDLPRGQTVSVPIEQCEASLDKLQSEEQLLLVSVANSTDSNPESIQIGFRVAKVGTWLVVWGRSFEID